MNLKEVCDYRFPATLADAVVKVDKKFSKSKFLKNFLKEIRAKKDPKQRMLENMIKHALRTLLKKGDESALKLIDIDCNNLSKKFMIENFSLQKESVKISQKMKFDFSLRN